MPPRAVSAHSENVRVIPDPLRFASDYVRGPINDYAVSDIMYISVSPGTWSNSLPYHYLYVCIGR